MGMDFNGIDKIKVNNAIVVFVLFINCVCCPISYVLIFDYPWFEKTDTIKVLIATISAGCSEFGCFYIFCILTLGFQAETITTEFDGKDVFQNPLIVASALNLLFYMFIVTNKYYVFAKANFLFITVISNVFLMMCSCILLYLFFRFDIKKKHK